MNRLLFLVIAVLFSISNLKAQDTLWPSSNAEWYYSFTDNSTFSGYSYFKIERDTSVIGKNCQIYSRTLTTIEQGGFDTTSVFDEVHFMLRIEDSALLAYNSYSLSFDTIVDFNGQIGDRWKSYYYEGNDFCNGSNNSDYIISEIYDKDTVIVNGKSLLKVAIKRIDPQNEIVFNFDEFYQYYGSNNGNFIFNKFCNTSTDFAYETNLRCFFYDSLSFQVQPCAKLPTLGIGKNKSNNTIKIINPIKNGEILFQNIDANNVEIIQVFNSMGKEIQIEPMVSGTNTITSKVSIEKGIYFYFIKTKLGNTYKGKIISF